MQLVTAEMRERARAAAALFESAVNPRGVRYVRSVNDPPQWHDWFVSAALPGHPLEFGERYSWMQAIVEALAAIERSPPGTSLEQVARVLADERARGEGSQPSAEHVLDRVAVALLREVPPSTRL